MQMVDDNVGNQVRHNAVQNDVGKMQFIIRIAQEEEARIQSTQEKSEFMAAADAYEETERVNVNCTSEDTLQQASTSGTQSDNALVYDSDGLTEVPKDENCYDHDIFNMLTHEVRYTNLQTELDRTKEKLENCIIKKEKEYVILWNNWYTKCKEYKYDKISYNKAYNDMQQKIKQLQAQLGDLKGKSNDTQCASNTLDLMSQKFEDENVSLEFQEPKGTKKGTRTNTTFTKKSILGKLPFSSYKPKLYSVTLFPKSLVLPKVDKTNALSKPVTSNSAPSTRESKVMKSVNVIAPRIFRTNPSRPLGVNNTAKTRRPHLRRNSNTYRVPSKSKSSCLPNDQCLVTANHDVCVLDYVNGMNYRADNQSANVSIRKNQKKHKANTKKSKELGSKGSFASSGPSKPRTCLRHDKLQILSTNYFPWLVLCSCSSWKVSMAPFVLSRGSSISPDSFLPSILMLVVVIVMVVIVAVILIFFVVAIVGVVIVVAIIEVVIVVTIIGIVVVVVVGVLLVFSMVAACASRAAATLSSGGGVIDLTGDEDPTDEDGDTRMDDSTRVSTSLGGEISSEGRKSQESNGDNTRGITVGEAIGACSGGIGNSLVASYACMTSIYGSSGKGEKTSVAKRYLVKSFEESGEVFPGVAGK
uniref:Uncharacterized protein n=1 Tax=Tanacetum cinerariifolium TaxID=118510 RepID=A0A6L2JBL5_TANCI|nr:hypothetical protein [Tanacetum cinerariifolium]